MGKIFINNLKIHAFRGLKDLYFPKFKLVNFILGDNNVGKTSVLESIPFSFCENIEEFLMTCNGLKSRSGAFDLFSTNYFETLFPIGGETINLEQNINKFKIAYKTNKLLVNKNLIHNMKKNNNDRFGLLEIYLSKLEEGDFLQQYEGVIYSYGKINKFSFSDIDLSSGYTFKDNDKRKNIIYSGPGSHFSNHYYELTPILKSDDFKKLLINLLKIFDTKIEDILLIADNKILKEMPNVYIKLENQNPMPLYLFGDGLKKVLSLAIKIVLARDGILLIDEIETSLSSSYFDDVFTFLIRCAKNFNVQLFITTHSKETIDAFLNINKLNNYVEDFLSIYTLRKRNGEYFIRNLSGKELDDLSLNSSTDPRK